MFWNFTKIRMWRFKKSRWKVAPLSILNGEKKLPTSCRHGRFSSNVGFATGLAFRDWANFGRDALFPFEVVTARFTSILNDYDHQVGHDLAGEGCIAGGWLSTKGDHIFFCWEFHMIKRCPAIHFMNHDESDLEII